MTFPTIPTTGASRVISSVQVNTTATRTFPDLSALTKNSGDLLIAIVVGYQSSVAGNAFSGWTAGWTEFGDNATATGMCIGAAYKVSNGTETGQITVTQAATITGHAAMMILSIPGASLAEGGGYLPTSAANPDPGSLTPSYGAADTLWIAVCGLGETTTAGTFGGITGNPINYGSGVVVNGSDVVGGTSLGLAFRQLNAASENPANFAVDTAHSRALGYTIAVKPAASNPPGAGAASGTWPYAGAATGRRSPVGAASGTWTFAGVATGTRSPVGVASGTRNWAGAAVGQAPTVAGRTGTASGTWPFAGAATGKRAPIGAGSGTWSFAGAAVGQAPSVGGGAIAFVDAQATKTSQPAGNTANFNITGVLPTGLASGNVMLMAIHSNRGTTESCVADPSGWTLVRTQADGTETSRYYVKVAGSSESAPVATYTNASSTLHNLIMHISAYSNVDQASPILLENSGPETGSTITTHSGPSLTNTDANAWGVAFMGARQVATPQSWTPGTGMTERLDTDGLVASANNHWALCEDTNGPVATGAWVAQGTTSTGTSVTTMWSVLLKPGSGGAPSGPTTKKPYNFLPLL